MHAIFILKGELRANYWMRYFTAVKAPKYIVIVFCLHLYNKTLWERIFGRGRSTGMILWTCLIAAKQSACITGALWAKLGKRGILREAWDEGRRKIKRLLPVHCSGSCNARYIYTKGRIACKLLNAIFYCGQSTKVYCYCVLFALV